MSMGVPVPVQPGDQLFSDGQPFTGAHPTNREFAEQLRAWGFTRRKEDGVHVVFRGPKGGSVRVIRSQLGRADTVTADKAARLAGVTAAQFWAGPPQPGHQAQPAGAAAAPRRRTGSARDGITSLVLAPQRPSNQTHTGAFFREVDIGRRQDVGGPLDEGAASQLSGLAG